MSQEYTPVAWVDETTSQQGTLINADRLDQMQTAHHYADGFEEVDAIPTEDPGVDYHKVVYCTEDFAFYRWDGTQWTADIDEDTKHLLDQEIARATQAEGELAQDIEDEATARANADTALGARIDAETEAREAVDRQISEQIGSLNGETLPLYRSSSTPTIQNAVAANEGRITNLTNTVEGLAVTKADSDNVVNSINGSKGVVTLYADDILRGAGQVSVDYCITDLYALIHQDYGELQASKADKATTLAGYGITDAYTKTETDTLLATKAPTTALTDGSVTKLGTVDVGTDTKPIKLVGGVPTAVTNDLVSTSGAQTIAGIKTLTNETIREAGNNYTRCFTVKTGVYSESGAPAEDKVSWPMILGNSSLSIFPYRVVVGQTASNDVFFADTEIHHPVTNKVATLRVSTTEAGPGRLTFNNGVTNSDVATIETLDGYSPMVRTTGNQTITGQKTISFPYGDYALKIKGSNSDVTLNQYQGNIPHLAFFDKNDVMLADIRVFIQANGRSTLVLYVRNADGTNKEIVLGDGNS